MEKIITSKKIGIALSGGGFRAASFHAGVLLYLAENDLLEEITHISSVSGGSLLTGLILNISGYKWPSSESYIKLVFGTIRETLTNKSLQNEAISRLILNPLNWKFLLSRANVVAQTIEEEWGISENLSSIKASPTWSINATTAETGRRFRFKNQKMGDFELGYASCADFPLAKAMAISAAFPGGIGPLSIHPTDYVWHNWGQDSHDEIKPPFSNLHLYDGGVYDNLGLEPLFDIGRQEIKDSSDADIDYVIVSDAQAPFDRTSIPNALNPLRLMRVADIAFDQTRALRVRSFVNFLRKNPGKGAYFQIGVSAIDSINKFSKDHEDAAKALLTEQWQSRNQAATAKKFPTTLKRLSSDDFSLIARHGYETAKWNTLIFKNKFPS